ncbi:haloalkane dehalogenase (plasmid) [Nostoc sp. UHCC 0926]|uniref:haloalkane dehalogenase n=1 Tax=Nostoc sp. UHCC 0926 TaxID=3025190 RepID=UPI002361177B|nr:haloalkane dehalogenase [Nostoc sp. UHCC 0926]WDD30114.1 haloalkane dehalogenase [Nostoc sp. UHCC 0926]
MTISNMLATLLPKAESPIISANFPYKSKFINVLGSRMHYVEAGEGNPILFLHGNPTSSYLWRNVMPYLENQGHVIAVDSIGFGLSDKPDSDYTFVDYARYIEGFIDALGLQNITLVTHEWGALFASKYARYHENNICGVVFMEVTIPRSTLFPRSEVIENITPIFECFRDPIQGPKVLIEENQFIETLLPGGIVRSLTESEMEVYREPFKELESRKSIFTWSNLLPIAGEPQYMIQVMDNYDRWLTQSDLPKLHIYGSPGIVNPPFLVAALTKILKNYETAYVGKTLHYLQEDEPEAIGLAISDWYRRLKLPPA